MTVDEYRDCIRAMGLTPRRPVYNGGQIHEDRNGDMFTIADPTDLTEDERVAMLDMIRSIVVGPTQ